MSDSKASLKAGELFSLVKDTQEVLETLWSPVPYELRFIMRRARKLIREIEEVSSNSSDSRTSQGDTPYQVAESKKEPHAD